ncbi:Uncharacterized protein HZ326_23502 [Fusarium oxysporum f. sp. albedinis]|nr:Uncharacterized protein HZ326_23502 [Fusarium oxysporum f. sp. albedinis]
MEVSQQKLVVRWTSGIVLYCTSIKSDLIFDQLLFFLFINLKKPKDCLAKIPGLLYQLPRVLGQPVFVARALTPFRLAANRRTGTRPNYHIWYSSVRYRSPSRAISNVAFVETVWLRWSDLLVAAMWILCKELCSS